MSNIWQQFNRGWLVPIGECLPGVASDFRMLLFVSQEPLLALVPL
jgi:hypothetical protein